MTDAMRSWDDETRAAVGLSLATGIGSRTANRLLDQFGSAAAIMRATRSELLSMDRVGPALVKAIEHVRSEATVDDQLQLCGQFGIDVIPITDERYPHGLREIPDPPSVLFWRGQSPGDYISIAIVGTRHPSPYGIRMASRFATHLSAQGITIVSGLARGIDAAAHQASLEIGGRTIGVLANGLSDIYPPEHRALAEEMIRRGALISENACQAKPKRGMFPRRNRLISGLCQGVIVVEAMDRSGALVTARHAAEQGREVFAVPGRVDQRVSAGCHALLRDGATLVRCVEDVLEELGTFFKPLKISNGSPMQSSLELQLNDQERRVLATISETAVSTNDIVRLSGIPVSRVLATLSVLETRRLVQRLGGDRFVRPTMG